MLASYTNKRSLNGRAEPRDPSANETCERGSSAEVDGVLLAAAAVVLPFGIAAGGAVPAGAAGDGKGERERLPGRGRMARAVGDAQGDLSVRQRERDDHVAGHCGRGEPDHGA